MRNVIIVLLICLTAGYIFYTYNQEREIQTSLERAEYQAQLDIDAMASSLREKAEALAKAKAAEEAKQLALMQAREAKEAAQAAKAAAQEALERVQADIAQAKTYLKEGNYQEAIDLAQSALEGDAQSQEAKGILEQAQQRLAALATEQAEKLKTNLSDKAEGITAGLPKLGE